MQRKLLRCACSISAALVFISVHAPVFAQAPQKLKQLPQTQTFNPKEFTIDKPVPYKSKPQSGQVQPGDTLIHRWQRSGSAPTDLKSKTPPQGQSGWTGWSNFYRSF